MYFDPMYLMFMLPGLVLAGIASLLTHSTFKKYSRVGAASGLTGAEAARRLLDANGLQNVAIEPTRGFLSDHFDPAHHVLRLSPDVYGARSLSAIGVACHEAGHALQQAQRYAPLMMRTALVPATQFSTNAAYLFILAGFLVPSLLFLAKVGVVLFVLGVVFALVTLPVEWDASARAKKLMVSAGIVTPREQPAAAAVLNAAFLTYVASAVTAILTLLYYMLRLGLLGGRRSD